MSVKFLDCNSFQKLLMSQGHLKIDSPSVLFRRCFECYRYCPYHPWDWYIYLLIYHKKSTIHVGKHRNQPNVGKYRNQQQM